mmetsp:Transcript_22140/g.50674  ORF Transcript_22140/g.50674 Transcript_22140/m.50674 type:complete len:138 (+) Transcript_22140:100-513(+)
MARDIPYAIFTLVTYEYIKQKWVRPNELKEGASSAWRNMVTGATAGGIGSFLTNPMDVVKTRLQTSPEIYGRGVLQCAMTTLQEEGPAAFLKGMRPRLMHKIPANAVFFLWYEFFRRVLNCEGASVTGSTSVDRPSR